eukprot:g19877.t1
MPSRCTTELRPDSLRAATRCLRDLGRRSSWQAALRLLNRLPEFQLEPNVFSFSAALSTCEKSSQWTWALQLVTEGCPNNY